MLASRVIGPEGPSQNVSQRSCHPGGSCSPVVLVYTMDAVVLIPKDRIRRALQFEEEMMDAIHNFGKTGSSAPDDPEWELPICLKSFPIEADYVHLLEIVDVSVTKGKSGVWDEAMRILCRLKTINEIGTSRIFASIEEFSFKKVQPL